MSAHEHCGRGLHESASFAVRAHVLLVICLVVSCVTPTAASSTGRCGAFTTPEGLYGGHGGTIKSDLDGYGDTDTLYFHASNDSCRWQIMCPNDRNEFLLYSIRGQLGVNASVQLRDPFGNISYYLNSSDFVEAEGFVALGGVDGNRVLLSFEAASGNSLGKGFDFNYTCVPSLCSSEQASRTLTTATGTIMTDIDGAGGTPYQTFERCQWNIQCPEGYRNGGITLNITGDTGEEQIEAVGTSWRTAVKNTQASPLFASFATSADLTLLLTAGSSAPGFTLHWKCLASRCPALAQNVTARGSTAGNVSVSITEPGRECAHEITCPPDAPYLAYTARANVFNRAGDFRLGGTPPEDNAKGITNRSREDSYSVIYDFADIVQSKMSVWASTQAATAGNRVTFVDFYLEYACHRTPCPSVVPTNVDMNYSQWLSHYEAHLYRAAAAVTMFYPKRGSEFSNSALCNWRLPKCSAADSALRLFDRDHLPNTTVWNRTSGEVLSSTEGPDDLRYPGNSSVDLSWNYSPLSSLSYWSRRDVLFNCKELCYNPHTGRDGYSCYVWEFRAPPTEAPYDYGEGGVAPAFIILPIGILLLFATIIGGTWCYIRRPGCSPRRSSLEMTSVPHFPPTAGSAHHDHHGGYPGDNPDNEPSGDSSDSNDDSSEDSSEDSSTGTSSDGPGSSEV